jgi:acyl-homoserine lactone acylase PvdQ
MIPQEVSPGLTTPPQGLTAAQNHAKVEQHRYWTTNNCFNTQKLQAGHTVFLHILISHRFLVF